MSRNPIENVYLFNELLQYKLQKCQKNVGLQGFVGQVLQFAVVEGFSSVVWEWGVGIGIDATMTMIFIGRHYGCVSSACLSVYVSVSVDKCVVVSVCVCLSVCDIYMNSSLPISAIQLQWRQCCNCRCPISLCKTFM